MLSSCKMEYLRTRIRNILFFDIEEKRWGAMSLIIELIICRTFLRLYDTTWCKIADSTRLFTHCLRRHEKSTCEKLVSAWFSMWTSQGLNLGPPDYESVALTNWATSPVSDEGVTKSSAKLVYYFGFSKFWGVFVLWRLFGEVFLLCFVGCVFCEMFCCGCFELFGIESLCYLL